MNLCRIASDYRFSGIEIFDPIKEMQSHSDSILRNDRRTDAKRWLNNRALTVPAITMPFSLDSEECNPETLLRYVRYAGNIGADYLIVRLDNAPDYAQLDKVLAPSFDLAAELDVQILLETVGYFTDTDCLFSFINKFRTGVLSACWNVRGTFFTAGASPEETIRSLGAFIRYVRLGDCLDGREVLIGEGDFPVSDFLDALHSLNYDGYICCDWNEDIDDPDIVLTHFVSYIGKMDNYKSQGQPSYSNRSHTGTYPWRKYDVINLTFSQVLDTIVEKYPDQTAFRYTTLDYTRSYAEFREDVDRVAAAFIALGVKPGYHVAVWATNVPAWFITFWAATKIGAVLVTVNSAYKISEVEYLLRQSDTHTLVMIEYSKDVIYSDIIRELCPELSSVKEGESLYSKRLPFLRNVITVDFEMEGCIRWEDLPSIGCKIPREEVRRRASMVRPDDVCNMQYTSGTTGFPKGVMLTHSNILNDGKIIGDRMDLSTADRMMIQVPMFHCFGMVLSMTSMMTHGGTLSPLPYFSAKSSLACINSERITCFNGVPTMFIAMFNHPDFASTDFSYMRTG
ncbi:MAG: AMP-binding protein, partial [Clostridia bacterium]|nr:AMP-binding protein [Clostridia bacterium]